jgi:phosphate transport system protein
MTSEHIVKSFDDQLNRLEHTIAEMGGLAESQLTDAIDALLKRDSDKAAQVAAADARIDDMETEVDQLAVSLLALRQPMASDLRAIVCALKTSAIIERIGDYAKNVAKRTAALAEVPPVPPAFPVARLGRVAQEMIKDVLDAYVSRDVEKADMVRERDKELDTLYTSIFRELLTYMMEDPRNITSCTHLLFVAKNIERIGDHTTNIAENVHFLVHGRFPLDERQKDDASSFAVVRPATKGVEAGKGRAS